MEVKYEGVSLNVEYVKSMTLQEFLANEPMRIHFKENEAVMKGAYEMISGKSSNSKKAGRNTGVKVSK